MAGKTKKSKGKKTPISKKSSHSKKSPSAKRSPHGKKSPNNKKKNTRKTDKQIEKQSGHAAVYLDVEFDRGLLYLVLVNGGDLPAEQVSVKFDKRLYGANGADLSALGIFKHLAFLPRRKPIKGISR